MDDELDEILVKLWRDSHPESIIWPESCAESKSLSDAKAAIRAYTDTAIQSTLVDLTRRRLVGKGEVARLNTSDTEWLDRILERLQMYEYVQADDLWIKRKPTDGVSLDKTKQAILQHEQEATIKELRYVRDKLTNDTPTFINIQERIATLTQQTSQGKMEDVIFLPLTYEMVLTNQEFNNLLADGLDRGIAYLDKRIEEIFGKS